MLPTCIGATPEILGVNGVPVPLVSADGLAKVGGINALSLLRLIFLDSLTDTFVDTSVEVGFPKLGGSGASIL